MLWSFEKLCKLWIKRTCRPTVSRWIRFLVSKQKHKKSWLKISKLKLNFSKQNLKNTGRNSNESSRKCRLEWFILQWYPWFCHYDSEFGDIVPEEVYDDGCTLGTAFATNDFFDREEGQPSWWLNGKISMKIVKVILCHLLKRRDQTFSLISESLASKRKKWSTPIVNDFATSASLKKLETEFNQIVRIAAQGDVTDRIVELVDHEISARVNGDLSVSKLNSMIVLTARFRPWRTSCDLDYEIEQVRDSISYRVTALITLNMSTSLNQKSITKWKKQWVIVLMLWYAMLLTSVQFHMRTIGSYVNVCVIWSSHKPSFTACVLRWLREGPSAKELATKWYAGLRRSRVWCFSLNFSIPFSFWDGFNRMGILCFSSWVQ